MSDAIPPASVDVQQPRQENSPIRSSEPTTSPVSSDVVICQWNGQPFLAGLRVRAAGKVYECCGDKDGPFWRPTDETD
jgi:hypothetical protein